MSIATEISKIALSRNTIRAKLVELGMANSTDKLGVLAEAIENLVNRGAVNITVKEGETVSIPAGYHNGSGTVSGVSGGGAGNVQVTMSVPDGINNTIERVFYTTVLEDGTLSTLSETANNVKSLTKAIASGSCFVVAYSSNMLSGLKMDGTEYLSAYNGYNMESVVFVNRVTAAAGENASFSI